MSIAGPQAQKFFQRLTPWATVALGGMGLVRIGYEAHKRDRSPGDQEEGAATRDSVTAPVAPISPSISRQALMWVTDPAAISAIWDFLAVGAETRPLAIVGNAARGLFQLGMVDGIGPNQKDEPDQETVFQRVSYAGALVSAALTAISWAEHERNPRPKDQTLWQRVQEELTSALRWPQRLWSDIAELRMNKSTNLRQTVDLMVPHALYGHAFLTVPAGLATVAGCWQGGPNGCQDDNWLSQAGQILTKLSLGSLVLSYLAKPLSEAYVQRNGIVAVVSSMFVALTKALEAIFNGNIWLVKVMRMLGAMSSNIESTILSRKHLRHLGK